MISKLCSAIEDFGTIPAVSYEDRKLNPDAGLVEFDSKHLQKIFGAILHQHSRMIAQDILDTESGFDQADGTFALYTYKRDLLKNMATSTWDTLRPEQRHFYTEEAKKAVLVFVTMMLEGEHD